MKTVRFGLIGLGLMGREFASAAARWCHLPEMETRPEIVAVCDTDLSAQTWYTDNFPTIKQATTDYLELLCNPDLDAVYCAVPHHLHQEIYCTAIECGKYLMGEKPFGIDKRANEAVLAKLAQHPGCFVRCSSEFPFFPGVQRLCRMIEQDELGRIIEVEAGFCHSSDLDPAKPINWKRMIRYNGEYGVMGDLGMHVCHVPFRAGWLPQNVRAVLSNIVPERPDGKGGAAPCETWDNATLLCETVDRNTGDTFPMTLKTQRIAPGEKNTWYLSVLGARASARFSTKNPKLLQVLRYTGGEQVWQHIDVGQEGAFKSITGGIFESGFSDAFLQMWAGYLYELQNGRPLSTFAGCVTPEETVLSHKLFTAALESWENGTVVSVQLKGED
ncbi:MAG: Gfo/Idh/MocA family oxidoreductase [Gemmatimonadota bacterium]|nr:Gfo/Idh/MocA family oxidoreductase [Gemmatimonadota bacterium]